MGKVCAQSCMQAAKRKAAVRVIGFIGLVIGVLKTGKYKVFLANGKACQQFDLICNMVRLRMGTPKSSVITKQMLDIRC